MQHFPPSVLPVTRGCCTTWLSAHTDPCYRPSSQLVFLQRSHLLLHPLSPLLWWDTPLLSSAPRGHTAPNTEDTKWDIMLRITVECMFAPLLMCMCVAYSFGPVTEVPVGHTGAHVTLLASLWAQPRVALLVIHHATLIAETTHTPCPSPYSTVHRAL